MERKTGFEPATFCLGSPDLVSAVARAWKGERITDSYGVAPDVIVEFNPESEGDGFTFLQLASDLRSGLSVNRAGVPS